MSAKQMRRAPASTAARKAAAASAGAVRLVSSTVKRTSRPRRTASRVASPMRASADSQSRLCRVASESGDTPRKMPTQSAPTSAAARTSPRAARAWHSSGVRRSISRTASTRSRSSREEAGWLHSTASTPSAASSAAISALALGSSETPGA